MSSFSTQFTVPNGDIISYLQGFWKRSLEWRHFGGGYQHLGTSNTIIAIEESDPTNGNSAGASAGPDQARAAVPSRRKSIDESRFMKWSFGGTMGPSQNDMTEGYIMKFIPDPSGTYMEWEHSGMRCYGNFDPGTSVITLNFNLENSKVTATYHPMDANTMAVCLIEVGSGLAPTLQYGNMYRVNAL